MPSCLAVRASIVVAACVLLAIACGPRTLKQKLLNAERRTGEAETLLDEADRAMQELEPDLAAEKIAAAKQAMADPDVEYYPERHMVRERLQVAEQRLPAVREERARRDLERAAAERQKEVESELETLRKALQAAQDRTAKSSELSDLAAAIDDVQDELEDGREIESKHQGYARLAAEARGVVEVAVRERDLLKAKIAFLEGPAEEWTSGRELAGRARSEKDRERRAELYADAADHFRTCGTEGSSALKATPRLASAPLVLGDSVTTARGVIQRCAAELEAVTRALKKRPAKKVANKPVSSSRKVAKKR